MLVHRFYCGHMSSFFMGEFLGAELSGQHGNCGLSHLSNCQTTLHNSCTLSILTNILNNPCSYAFFKDSQADECEPACRCGFVCISLMAIGIKQLHMCTFIF